MGMYDSLYFDEVSDLPPGLRRLFKAVGISHNIQFQTKDLKNELKHYVISKNKMYQKPWDYETQKFLSLKLSNVRKYDLEFYCGEKNIWVDCLMDVHNGTINNFRIDNISLNHKRFWNIGNQLKFNETSRY